MNEWDKYEVDPTGFAPATDQVTTDCSTIELRAHAQNTDGSIASPLIRANFYQLIARLGNTL